MTSSDLTLLPEGAKARAAARVGASIDIGGSGLDATGVRVGFACAEFNGGITDRLLTGALDALVSAGGVLVAIYNSMSARSRDIAILRALGARRRTIFSAVVLEAAAIGLLGMIVSFVAYLAIVSGVAALIRAQTGVLLNAWSYDPVMVWAPIGMIFLCALGGLVPAWKAYRTDVASNLAPVS